MTRPWVWIVALACAAVTASAQQGEPIDHVCARDIHKFVSFRDPDTIRITSISKGEMEVIDYADRRLVAVKFTVMVNSKNQTGGYSGAHPYQCWTSEDRQRVLDYKPRQD